MAVISMPFGAFSERRAPTPAELSAGFPCGELDQQLFNWMHWRQTSQTPWWPVISVTETAPPGAPQMGDMYVIPLAATGDWTGHAQKVAEWTGADWAVTTAPDGHAVSLPDGSVMIKVSGVYTPLRATDSFEGLARRATQDEVDDGVNNEAFVTPATLRDVEAPNFRLAVPSITLPSGVDTDITSYGVGIGLNNMPSSDLTGGVITMGPDEEGLWMLMLSMRTNNPSALNIHIWAEIIINGTVSTVATSLKSSAYNQYIGTSLVDLRSIGATATLQARLRQENTGPSNETFSMRFMGVRLAGVGTP